MDNCSYFFVPMYIEGDWRRVTSGTQTSRDWDRLDVEVRYMLKYVADKLNMDDQENCLCTASVLRPAACEELGLPGPEELCCIGTHQFGGQPENFPFCLKNIRLYCFDTTVCVMAIKVEFVRSDPRWIATAQYYLKKLGREPVRRANGSALIPGRPQVQTLYDLAGMLMERLGVPVHPFFHCSPGIERANVLSLTHMPGEKDPEQMRRDLYYLRRCQSEGFLYQPDEVKEQREVYDSSADVAWGISAEAAACLVFPEMGRGDFIKRIFVHNFDSQYLFTYVLLLHQKYVLYLFLTRIGVGRYNDLKALEEYRQQLYEFETNHVFTTITEVDQYDRFYRNVGRAFALYDMYKDVREPIVSLRELQREKQEEERKQQEEAQKQREERMNNALALLSILTVFSALTDGVAFIEQAFGLLQGILPAALCTAEAMVWWQRGYVVLVVLAFLMLMRSLLFGKRKGETRK
ncbi:MAG: hypothetical protein IJ484_07785 [Oscillospiraceae bacterium]|nr:hypothetical protein [Oscillospiraceae bacterium]